MSFQKPNEINVTPIAFELIWTAMIYYKTGINSKQSNTFSLTAQPLNAILSSASLIPEINKEANISQLQQVSRLA